MKVRFLLLVGIALLMHSCSDKSVVFDEHQKLSENVEWLRSDKRTFRIDIKDNSWPFTFILKFRYATGFQFKNMIMRITETDPMGHVTMRDVDFYVRDERGEFIGDAGYDIMDLQYQLDKEKALEFVGTYTYELEHAMASDTLHYAMEVGLKLIQNTINE